MSKTRGWITDQQAQDATNFRGISANSQMLWTTDVNNANTYTSVVIASKQEQQAYHKANNTVANINPNLIMEQSADNSLMSNVIMQMQGESPLDKGMLPKVFGENDGDSSGDNFRF